MCMDHFQDKPNTKFPGAQPHLGSRNPSKQPTELPSDQPPDSPTSKIRPPSLKYDASHVTATEAEAN